uniref:FAD-dependent oxidoreductase n=1 Tax=Tahibacter caeni TaxID=1453545 RepID=UPI0021490352
VVGAGPAGLACAHALARAGHEVAVFDAKPRPGGLNEYGIAEYKVLDFAGREIDWLLSIGGITWQGERALGDNLQLAELRRDYDAVFLGLGLTGVNALGIEGEALAGVRNAVDFIADLRQCPDLAKLPVGRRVVVIGGGNTAIDAAVQSKKLGAESVTLVYRRSGTSMSATSAEQEFAKTEGVNVIEWAQPRRILGGGAVAAIEFEYTQLDANGRLLGSGDYFTLAADTVLKAIGQTLVAPRTDGDGSAVIEIRNGRIAVNAEFETSVRGVWAGGDCVGGKVDLTVQSVEDGKRAARAIHARLSGNGTAEN